MKETESRILREILFFNSEHDVVMSAAKRVRIAVPTVVLSEGQRYYNEEGLLDEVSPGAILVRTIANCDGYERFWSKYEELAKREAKKKLAKRIPKSPRLVSRRPRLYGYALKANL
jgi:hypothetical protein